MTNHVAARDTRGQLLSNGGDIKTKYISFPGLSLSLNSLVFDKVTIDGLAHTAGLQAGDVIVRLNGEPISQLTHAQAYNKLVSAGDDIVLSVVRSHEIAQRQGQ